MAQDILNSSDPKPESKKKDKKKKKKNKKKTSSSSSSSSSESSVPHEKLCEDLALQLNIKPKQLKLKSVVRFDDLSSETQP